MPTTLPSESRITPAQFHSLLARLPDSDRHRYELLSGRVTMTPPPGWPHPAVASNLVFHLRLHVDAHFPGARVLESSNGYDLPTGDCVQPDVSLISKATLDCGPAPVAGKSLAFAPDLAVEVLSPSTARRDLADKRSIYERAGVAEYWVVDPTTRSVVIFTRESVAPPGATSCFDAGTTWTS